MSNSDNKDRLLRVRDAKNKKRPKFKRENYYRLKRIQTSWRSAKGIDSKMRHKLKGKRKSPGTGYRNPRAVRGLHPTGKEIVQVANLKDLEAVNAENQVAQIKSSVGSRKRLVLIDYAEENEIHIINPQIRIADFDEDFDEVFVEADDEVLLEDEEEDDE